MRCLHCGNRISLLRKLKDSEFCSDEHREFYALQQQQMAVSRLMETSSPKHKQLPELIRQVDSDRALPRGTDRRALNTAAAAPVAEPRPAPTPEPPTVVAAAVPVAAPPLPVSTAPMPPVSKSPGGFVSQMPNWRDWAPRRRRTFDPEAGELMPVLAAPRLERTRQRRLIYGRMLEISGSHDWSRPGLFAALPFCEAPVAGVLASTLSEILSLSMNGFVCERALVLDLTPVSTPAPEPVHLEAEPEPEIELEPVPELVLQCALAQSAEAGLGAAQLPQAQRGGLTISAIEDLPLAPSVPPQPAGLPRAPLGLRGQLPEIDWTVERLDQVAARHEPGLVRLRTPRLRSPQLARLVKPAAGNSGPPIRVRPSVRPPEGGSCLTLGLLAMPTGAKVALPQFDRLVTGIATLVTVSPEPLTPKIPVRLTGCASVQMTPGMALATMVPLPLRGSSGPALAAGAALESLAASIVALGLPSGPFVRGNDFDPPMGGRLPLVFEVKPRQPGAAVASKPPCRPVISYRWTPVNPEYHAVPEADWELLPRSMAQLTLGNPFREARGPIASSETEPMASFQVPSMDSVRMATAHSPAGSNRLSIAARMVPVSLDKNKPRGGSPTPISRLEHIAPKPGHQLRKSTLKTQADWQRNKWASASVYGSALWRIAIGRFSGAIDQAPKSIRWGAGLVALALGAFALFPSNQLAAPGDTGWTMANKPGGASAETAVAAAPPPPRRVRVQAPPRAAAANLARPVRVQPAVAGGDGPSLTGVWDNFQKGLSDRAAVAYTDDFRNGLAEWQGAGDWARSWSYDASGFVRTGGLALLASARELTDYRMEFLGQIERRSMGWVVRASDLRNYYALKLTIIGDGPVPEVALIRYPVVNGVAGAASQQVLPIDVRADTVYRVQTEVRGDYYAVTVQGKVVDSWTDARLKRGSIGLFSGKGELARVRWVGVWHQYDTLGRLCALLAPSGLPGRERGANQ